LTIAPPRDLDIPEQEDMNTPQLNESSNAFAAAEPKDQHRVSHPRTASDYQKFCSR